MMARELSIASGLLAATWVIFCNDLPVNVTSIQSEKQSWGSLDFNLEYRFILILTFFHGNGSKRGQFACQHQFMIILFSARRGR